MLGIVDTGRDAVGNNTVGAADNAAGASVVCPVRVAPVDDGLVVPVSADDADATLADDVAPVDDGI